MPRVFPTGHRHRGAGFTTAASPDIIRALMLASIKGQTWYVDSGVPGGVAGSGDSWGSAFLTLQAAINAAIAGDTIFVANGHAENISAAGSVTVNKAGLKIIGVGVGRNRPVFTWTTVNTATFLVTAANVYIENMVFIGEGIDGVVTMFNITGDDCTFNGCEFQIGKTSFVPLLGITLTAVNRFKFYNNYVHGLAVANCTNFIQIAGASGNDGHEFVSNYIKGNFTTSLGCINNITTACTNIMIYQNVLINATASATKVVVLVAGSTGGIHDNRVGIGSGAAPFTASAAHWGGNWSAAAVATDSTLV